MSEACLSNLLACLLGGDTWLPEQFPRKSLFHIYTPSNFTLYADKYTLYIHTLSFSSKLRLAIYYKYKCRKSFSTKMKHTYSHAHIPFQWSNRKKEVYKQ